MKESGESAMFPTRILLAASALLLGLGLVAADDTKPNPQPAKKARQEARLKARQEAEAKAKAEEEAKAKAEAEAKAKQEAEAKAKADAAAKRKSAPKADHLALARRIDDEINK